MLSRAQLLRISKLATADMIVGKNADDIKASDTPADLGLASGDMPSVKDSLTVRVRNGLTNAEQTRFNEQDYRNELQFDSKATISEITDDSEDGQVAALA
jgi:hypothetical protein